MKSSNSIDIDGFIRIADGRDKWQTISDLSGILIEAGLVDDTEIALRDLLERERSLSTGMTDGLAIPHARTRTVTRRCAALGVSDGGVDFDSIDGEPARLIFLVLTPVDGTSSHLEYLSRVATASSDPTWRSALEACGSLAEARSVLIRMS